MSESILFNFGSELRDSTNVLIDKYGKDISPPQFYMFLLDEAITFGKIHCNSDDELKKMFLKAFDEHIKRES